MKIKDLLKLDIRTMMIAVLIIVIILMRACEGDKKDTGEIVKIDGKKYEVVDRKTDTVYVPTKVVEYRPGKKIYLDKIIQVEVPSKVDTASILKNYYAKRIYIDTLKLADSLGYIVVNDTISENTILGRLWNAQVNKITIKDQVIVKELPRNQVYIGLVGGFDPQNIVNFFGPSVVLKTKTDKLYSVGIGYSGNKTVSVQGGIYWKIKLKK
jgi:hypothetical protein